MERKAIRHLILAAVLLLAACQPPPPPSAVGGPFQLVDQNGRTVDETILKGKWSAIYFGFTHCPDFCPVTLHTLDEAIDQLGAKGKDLQVVLITVDPERDTPQLLKAYLDNPDFPAGTIGLTGTPAQVDEAAKAYKVYYKKAGEGEAYTVDHLTVVFLVDPKGRFVKVIGHGTPPDEIARQISKAMQGRA